MNKKNKKNLYPSDKTSCFYMLSFNLSPVDCFYLCRKDVVSLNNCSATRSGRKNTGSMTLTQMEKQEEEE